jgi:hypothetical protein
MIEVDLNVLICSTVTQQPQLSATWLAQLSQSHMGESQEKEKKRKEKKKTPVPNAANFSSKAKMENQKQHSCGVALEVSSRVRP